MEPIIQILHLEDDPADAELVQARLAEAGLSCHIILARTRDEFERDLGSCGADIILADYRLPMYDGMSALRLANDLQPDIPFIFVSGTMGEEAAIEALTKGATDYVLKENLSRLPSAVRRALEEARNQRERKQAEEALSQSEIKMRCILDSVDEGFIVIDRNYRILSANKAFCNMTGFHEDQVIGKRCHEVTYEKTLPCFESGEECPVKRTFETERDAIAFHSHTDRSGTKCHMELRSYPMADTSGAIISVIETLNDVTEKHKLQEQLAQSQKMESVARLAGGVAHDFNNMLSVIMGHAELAMEQMNPSQPLFADLQEIQKASERSAALVNQLLAFARKQPVAPMAIDLNKIVASMLKMLRPLIGEDIDLLWRPGKDIWPVKMDPSQIDQILANLCVNARDAITGVGTITIATSMATIDPDAHTHDPESVPGEYVSLTVSDDGCGMDHKTLSQIFEPFFTTKGVGEGTGLGLSMVYGIVKQNNGFINVSSEPGRGTTFNLFLPRYATETTEMQRQDRAKPAPGGHETILLVEDETSILNMGKLMLERLEYRVLPASTPREALRVANAHDGDIHLLIVDVIMPDMNGRDLAKQIVVHHPEMACLYMSGYTGDIISKRGVLDEGLHFIAKPFSMQNLAAKVRQILDAVQGDGGKR